MEKSFNVYGFAILCCCKLLHIYTIRYVIICKVLFIYHSWVPATHCAGPFSGLERACSQEMRLSLCRWPQGWQGGMLRHNRAMCPCFEQAQQIFFWFRPERGGSKWVRVASNITYMLAISLLFRILSTWVIWAWRVEILSFLWSGTLCGSGQHVACEALAATVTAWSSKHSPFFCRGWLQMLQSLLRYHLYAHGDIALHTNLAVNKTQLLSTIFDIRHQ